MYSASPTVTGSVSARRPATGRTASGRRSVRCLTSKARSAQSRSRCWCVDAPGERDVGGDDMSQPAPATAIDTSTRQRILLATAEVLGRNGKTKLSLSEVATQAGVSRPTLYRWFASKEDLLSAFSKYERQTFESGMGRATAGLKGTDKLDAALRFIVEYQHSYTGVRMVDIEPEHVIAQFSNVIPQMRDGLQRLIPGPNAAVKAATAIRVAFSHYMIRSDDADEFLAQLRHAVGIKPS